MSTNLPRGERERVGEHSPDDHFAAVGSGERAVIAVEARAFAALRRQEAPRRDARLDARRAYARGEKRPV